MVFFPENLARLEVLECGALRRFDVPVQIQTAARSAAFQGAAFRFFRRGFSKTAIRTAKGPGAAPRAAIEGKLVVLRMLKRQSSQ
jgi:hypothetical protein